MLKPLVQTLLVFFVLSARILTIHGQESIMDTSRCSHTQTVYFRFDKVNIDSAYIHNRPTLYILDSLFTNPASIASIDSLCIRAYSSPEGREAYNVKLSRCRSASMKKYLTDKYPLLPPARISLSAGGENWDGLRELVSQDTNFNEREEVLTILDSEEDPAQRERLLKHLNSGLAYKYLYTHIFPLLRNAMVCTVRRYTLFEDPTLFQRISNPLNTGRLTTIEAPLNILASSTQFRQSTTTQFRRISNPPNTQGEPRYSALKTNLAVWAATAVNLAYEVQIGKRLSLDLPLLWSSWDATRHHALRIVAFQPELRYWLARPGQGHFFGIHAHAARYNLKWNDARYQDTHRPLLGAGISYGYLLPFNDTWGMEFNLGAGYAHSRYNLYRNIHPTSQGQLVDIRTLHHWGITRLGLSFIYKLPQP